MGVIDEQKDKSGKNKPPLLPKPCVSSSSTGSGDQAIPQMIISSPDDVAEELQNAAKSVPQIAITESEATCVAPDITEGSSIDAAEASTAKESVLVFSPKEAPVEKPTQSDDGALHSAIQRPLVIESEKSINVVKGPVIESNEQKVQAPTAMQRPLIFDSSNQQSEPVHEALVADDEEQNGAELQLVFNASKKTEDEISPSLEDASTAHERSKKCEDMKTKPGFLKKHGFPTIHFGGKDSSEVHPDKVNEQLVSQKELDKKQAKDSQHGIKHFFTSLIHEQGDEKHDEVDSPKDEHKDLKHGVKKFFDSFKQDASDKECQKITQSQDASNLSHLSKEQPAIFDEHGDAAPSSSKHEEKHGMKKFFDSFKHEKESKEKVEEHPDQEKSPKEPNKDLKQSVKSFFDSFKHDAATEEKSNINDQHDKIEECPKEAQKETRHSVKKFFDSFKHDTAEEGKEKSSKQPQGELEGTDKEHPKESKHGIKNILDSFTHKVTSTATIPSKDISDKEMERQNEHIYDEVRSPDSNQDAHKKPKEGPHSVKKLFDSFRYKDGQKPGTSGYKTKAEDEFTKQDQNAGDFHEVSFDSPVTSVEMGTYRKIEPSPEESKSKETGHGFKQFFSPLKERDSSKVKIAENKKPHIQKHSEIPDAEITFDSLIETEDSKSIFSSLKPKFMTKEKSTRFKDEKTPKQESKIQEYDLQNAGVSDELPEHVVGKFKPISDDFSTNEKTPASCTKSSNLRGTAMAPHASIEINGFDADVPESSKESPKCKEPGTPESLYETCCVRLAVLLRNKALDIVAEHTKSPPRKPPKPSAEAIAQARAAAVEKRVKELRKRHPNFGDDLPIGVNGIRYADDETESSGDYKDVENLDYIMDYELVNRYKFDKLDTFSVPSTCSGMTSYYTADTCTLKDENFSDTALETVSLGSSDSYQFKDASFVLAKSDVSLEQSVKGSKTGKLSHLLSSSASPQSAYKGQTDTKKVPPPIPPKPAILPKSIKRILPGSKTGEVSQCVNGLSLSPRLPVKGKGDSAGTQRRPLTIAGVKETEFSSLRKTNAKDQKLALKDIKFDTVLKNESLRNLPSVGPFQHAPLSATKSSPPRLAVTKSSPDLSLRPKVTPQRPPPPKNRTPVVINEQKPKTPGSTSPKPPEKPKRESAAVSASELNVQRMSSPQRPPPPAMKTPVKSPFVQQPSTPANQQPSTPADQQPSTPADQQPSTPVLESAVEPLPSTLKKQVAPPPPPVKTPIRSPPPPRPPPPLRPPPPKVAKLPPAQQEDSPDVKETELKENKVADDVIDGIHEKTPICSDSLPIILKPEVQSLKDDIHLPPKTISELTDADKATAAPSLTEYTNASQVINKNLSNSYNETEHLESIDYSNSEIIHSVVPELSTMDNEISQIPLKPPQRKPKRPPRTHRVRSRTVEVVPSEKMVEPRKRRSQSLSDVEVEKEVCLLDKLPTPEKVELKHLYTSVNKNGKKRNLVADVEDKLEIRSSSLEKIPSRPLPAPPPPPRKFRSLGHKPKEREKTEFDSITKFHSSENVVDSNVKPPVRRRKSEKQRLFSLGSSVAKGNESYSQEDVKSPLVTDVPFRPERHQKHHIEPSYDENANVSFPVVAEVHHLDSESNENFAFDSNANQNIPRDTESGLSVEITAESISPHPRQKKSGSVKTKKPSSWYTESDTTSPKPVEDTWEILDWKPSEVLEAKPQSHVKMRRRSDPVKKTQYTSKFYVDVHEDNVSAPLAVDKETSPLPLDCSEKSVQTSLETLSHGAPSQDGQSDDTDDLLDLAQTLQNELKTILNRHKSPIEYNGSEDSQTPPLSPEDKATPDKKRRKSDSVRSSTSELWQMTSSESEGELAPGEATNLTEIALSRKQKKIFYVAQELMTSEEVFVDALKLLNVDFKAFVEAANKQRCTHVIPDEILSQILNHLPQLQHLNENLLMELKDRIENWERYGKIADVIVKMGPFLKLYSWFIHDFEATVALLEDSKKKYPLFSQVVSEFEKSSRCKRLSLNHFLLKPIQRIPQYRLLLQEYRQHLPENSPDFQDTITAIQIVSEVANHANESMKQGDNVQKLFSIQNSILGHKEIIKPGRVFIREGELMKLSRKGMQPRWFVLLNDLLLYLTPVQQGLYRVNHELALTGMKVAIPIQQDYQNEFSIISVTRSFTLAARSPEERQEWIVALTKAIEENASKRSTFTNVRLQQRSQNKNSEDDEEIFVLGRKAPVWIPDARVTMCQLCTSEFTVTFRRHHCRACGKVVCSICSSNRISLPYLGNRIARVCDECHLKIGPGSGGCTESGETDSDNQQIAIKPHLRTDRHIKKGKRNLPSVLKEVCANDQGSTISGYLQLRSGKSWKRDWFVVKDKVLYEYKASEDVAALRSVPLLGYQIESFDEPHEGIDSSLLIKLTHPGQAPIIFHADTVSSTERWATALKEASVLE